MEPDNNNQRLSLYHPAIKEANIQDSSDSKKELDQTPGWRPATFDYQPPSSLDQHNWRSEAGGFSSSSSYEAPPSRFFNVSAERQTGTRIKSPYLPDDPRARIVSSSLAHALESSDRAGPSTNSTYNRHPDDGYNHSRRTSYDTRLSPIHPSPFITDPLGRPSNARYPADEMLPRSNFSQRDYNTEPEHSGHYSNPPPDLQYLPERGGSSHRRNSSREEPYLTTYQAILPSTSSNRATPLIAEYASASASRQSTSNQVAQQNNSTLRHACQFCGKRFIRPSSLSVHLNTHTGEQPFVCPEENCGRSFSVLSNMRRHLRAQHRNNYNEDNH